MKLVIESKCCIPPFWSCQSNLGAPSSFEFLLVDIIIIKIYIIIIIIIYMI
jgi:hypothetical protein